MQLYRWTRIVFWDLADLTKLHLNEEKLANLIKTELRAGRRMPRIHWHDTDFIKSMDLKYNLIPYWPDQMKDEQIRAHGDQFIKQIYPIWAGQCRIGQDYHDLDDHYNQELLHRVDMAIFESGYKPDRHFMDAKQAAMEIRKNALKSGFARAMGD